MALTKKKPYSNPLLTKDKKGRGSTRSRPYNKTFSLSHVSKPDITNNAGASSTSSTALDQSKAIYVVCDTNVWIKKLLVITSILHDPQMVNYIIYVPHRVGEELDKKKNDGDPDTCENARKAINVLNKLLKLNDGRTIQQTSCQNRTAKLNYCCKKADDEILAACLRLRSEGKKVEICTLDKQLESNALANELPPHPPITPKMRRKIAASKYYKMQIK